MPTPRKPAKPTAAHLDHEGRMVYPLRRYVVLFDDGTTAEVVGIRDDSELRGAVLVGKSPDTKIAGISTGEPAGWTS